MTHHQAITEAASIGTFLPYELSNLIPQDLNGSGCRSFLQSNGFSVVSNCDTGRNGEAVTTEGIVLSTSGFVCYRQLPPIHSFQRMTRHRS